MSAVNGKILLKKNDCYKVGQKMIPKGIVVHSTGANNPYIKRYVQPDDGVIGENQYNNDWNRSGLDVCVHGFIGKDKENKVKFYQTLPFDFCCWGVGVGSKGSYNYKPPYIQFEMCEDGLQDKEYCTAVYNKAVNVCVYLCEKYGIPVNNIVSHKEAHEKGYGSNHGDPDNWWGKHGYTMDKFRKAVKKKLNNTFQEESIPKEYRAKIRINDLNIREGAGTDFAKVGIIPKGVYTIVAEKNGKGATKWGKLKSGAGWISLDFVTKIG